MDIAERMQCPPDFPAAAAVVALGSVIGRRCGIRPKRQDDWMVVPNLWGAVIGRPVTRGLPACPSVDQNRHGRFWGAGMANNKSDEQAGTSSRRSAPTQTMRQREAADQAVSVCGNMHRTCSDDRYRWVCPPQLEESVPSPPGGSKTRLRGWA